VKRLGTDTREAEFKVELLRAQIFWTYLQALKVLPWIIFEWLALYLFLLK
jgi:hypothetical protein